jgi:hypothetical protein
MKRSKFGNIKIVYNDIKFDSKKELKRYKELLLIVKSGLISDLSLQPVFILQDGYRHKFFGKNKNGEFKKDGLIKYIADFKYFDIKKGQVIIEDVKSAFSRKDKVYRLKIKLLLLKYPGLVFNEYL